MPEICPAVLISVFSFLLFDFYIGKYGQALYISYLGDKVDKYCERRELDVSMFWLIIPNLSSPFAGKIFTSFLLPLSLFNVSRSSTEWIASLQVCKKSANSLKAVPSFGAILYQLCSKGTSNNRRMAESFL